MILSVLKYKYLYDGFENPSLCVFLKFLVTKFWLDFNTVVCNHCTGQVHKGIADEWYGETGRELAGRQYDVEAVLGSRAAVAVAGYTTKQQIRQKYNKNNHTKQGSNTFDPY